MSASVWARVFERRPAAVSRPPTRARLPIPPPRLGGGRPSLEFRRPVAELALQASGVLRGLSRQRGFGGLRPAQVVGQTAFAALELGLGGGTGLGGFLAPGGALGFQGAMLLVGGGLSLRHAVVEILVQGGLGLRQLLCLGFRRCGLGGGGAAQPLGVLFFRRAFCLLDLGAQLEGLGLRFGALAPEPLSFGLERGLQHRLRLLETLLLLLLPGRRLLAMIGLPGLLSPLELGFAVGGALLESRAFAFQVQAIRLQPLFRLPLGGLCGRVELAFLGAQGDGEGGLGGVELFQLDGDLGLQAVLLAGDQLGAGAQVGLELTALLLEFAGHRRALLFEPRAVRFLAVVGRLLGGAPAPFSFLGEPDALGLDGFPGGLELCLGGLEGGRALNLLLPGLLLEGQARLLSFFGQAFALGFQRGLLDAAGGLQRVLGRLEAGFLLLQGGGALQLALMRLGLEGQARLLGLFGEADHLGVQHGMLVLVGSVQRFPGRVELGLARLQQPGQLGLLPLEGGRAFQLALLGLLFLRQALARQLLVHVGLRAVELGGALGGRDRELPALRFQGAPLRLQGGGGLRLQRGGLRGARFLGRPLALAQFRLSLGLVGLQGIAALRPVGAQRLQLALELSLVLAPGLFDEPGFLPGARRAA